MEHNKKVYVAALHWFGYTTERAEIIYNERKEAGTLYGINHIVKEYQRNFWDSVYKAAF